MNLYSFCLFPSISTKQAQREVTIAAIRREFSKSLHLEKLMGRPVDIVAQYTFRSGHTAAGEEVLTVEFLSEAVLPLPLSEENGACAGQWGLCE